MEGHQQDELAPGSIQDAYGRPARNPHMQSGTPMTEVSPEHGGLGANQASAWAGTAFSRPQAAGLGGITMDLNPSIGSPSAASYTDNTSYTTEDSNAIDPRRLMVDTRGIQPASWHQSSFGDTSLGTPSGPNGGDARVPYSPLRHQFENLGLSSPSPVDTILPSPANFPYSAPAMTPQSFHGAFHTEYQAPHDNCWQFQPHATFPASYNVGGSHGMSSNEIFPTEFVNQSLFVGHEAPGAMVHVDSQGRGNTVYNMAGPSAVPSQSTDADFSTREVIGHPVIISPSPAQDPPNVPTSTASQIGDSSSRQNQSRASVSEPSRPVTGIVMSTGHGPVTRMYDPTFKSPRSQYGRSEEALPVPGPSQTKTEQEDKSRDKGKGKLVLRKDDDHSRRPSPINDDARPYRKKRTGVITSLKKKALKTIRRALPIRPSHIDCPLCGARVSNHVGFIRQHVESNCSSSVVQTIRDQQQAGPSRGATEPRAKIRCPTCRGKRRDFETLTRWAGHLCHEHGEWLTYECDIPGCGERFVSQKERNEHVRREH